jgi:SAM-dependent methyltransferase
LLFYKLIKLWEDLAIKISFLKALYLHFSKAKAVVAREIAASQITSKDRVLVIGCGSLPYTAELIARQTGATVVAIDNDPNAIRKASRYVRQRGLDGVDIKQGDGFNYPLSTFTVIIIVLGVKPKGKIVERVILEAQEEARIIYREPRDLGNLYNARSQVLRGVLLPQSSNLIRESILVTLVRASFF